MVITVMFIIIYYLLTVTACSAEELSESEFVIQACDQTIKGHDILSSRYVNSLIECFVLCASDELCHAVTYNKHELSARGQTFCKMKLEATLSKPYQIWTKKDVCYTSLGDLHSSLINDTMVDASTQQTMTEIETETTELPTSQSAQLVTASSQSYIIGAVETVTCQCNVYSYYDVAVLTQDGVYIYDDFTHLYSSPGPCKVKQAFSDVFKSVGTLAINEVDAIMSYNMDRVEIYANNQVWSIVYAGASQYGQIGYPMTYSDHLKIMTTSNTITQFPVKPVWGTLRARYGTQERYFYENDNIYYYANFNPFFAEIEDWDQDVLNVNNVNINPWTDLPTNIVDVMLIPSQFDDYLVITTDQKVYGYKLHYGGGNLNQPIKKLDYLGEIIF